MDARSDTKHVTLAVDLDGTLIATDLLWESVFALLRANPLYAFMLPIWLAGGICRLKHEIARRVELDPASLPYRAEVVDRLRAERKAKRKIVLATAAHEKFAQSIAAHLGLFDRVHASSSDSNLKAANKRDTLKKNYGDAGFDYIGNSRDDISIFDTARTSIIVAPDRAARRWGEATGAEMIHAPKRSLKLLFRMLRAHQWLKNTLIVVPMILSHEYLNAQMLLECLVAFVSFSAAASAIYIINDFFDLPVDRLHATKRNRPFASGALSISFGLWGILVLLTVSVATAFFLPPLFGVVLAIYLATTVTYSLVLKRMLLIDVLTLAWLYTVRILAGAAATETLVSFWLLAFSIFFFLSLALVKRYVELAGCDVNNGDKIAGRGYRPEDLGIIAQGGMASAFSAALVLALYIDSAAVRELYADPWMVWPLAPMVLYITLRIWVLAGRNEMNDDPVVFIVRDWRSQIVMALGAALLLIAGLQ